MDYRALLIDPAWKRVTEVETEGTLDDLYRLLACTQVEALVLAAGEILYFDEEALHADDPGPFFSIRGYEPIAGRGLIIGIDDVGEHAGSKMLIGEIDIDFPDVKLVGFEALDGNVRVGKRLFRPIGTRPIFKKRDETN